MQTKGYLKFLDEEKVTINYSWENYQLEILELSLSFKI